jgi:hypothetical protein
VACKWLFIIQLKWLFIKNYSATILKLAGGALGLKTHILATLLAPSAPGWNSKIHIHIHILFPIHLDKYLYPTMLFEAKKNELLKGLKHIWVC